jgi:hypothetical protein
MGASVRFSMAVLRGKTRKTFNLRLDELQREPIVFEECHQCTLNV